MNVIIAIIMLMVALLLFGIFIGIPSVLGMKYFERHLIWQECLFIFTLAYFVMAVFLVIPCGAYILFGIKSAITWLPSIVWVCLFGWMISRTAQRYGIYKKGRLGLGTKIVLVDCTVGTMVAATVLAIYFPIYSVLKNKRSTENHQRFVSSVSKSSPLMF